MATRKTIPVATVVEKVNRLLAAPDSTHVNADVRKGAYSLLESILFETGTYAGFNYLEWLNGGCDRWRRDGEPADKEPYLGDQSRRVYFLHSDIR